MTGFLLAHLIQFKNPEFVFKQTSLYNFKDEDHLDPFVKVSAMKRMFAQITTPDSWKRQVALPNVCEHVMGSYIKSKDLESVKTEVERFAKEILKMNLK